MNQPTVSFVVPTLNRGDAVLRAVGSCLRNGDSGVAVEVIVLDSQSDDGSFESLKDRFGEDARVTLLQNQRGLGPTRSWLDGAEHARGEAVTFVWSDDFISPDFVRILMPGLSSHRGVAMGAGIVRSISESGPLPSHGQAGEVNPFEAIRRYYLRWRQLGPQQPVSPCCSLFSKSSFDAWRAAIGEWCRATPLRHELQWKRAIGPDLMLYLAGLRQSSSDVLITSQVTAQFSCHPASITVSSGRWPYEAGYWLARVWLLETMDGNDARRRAQYVELASLTIAFGVLLALGSLVMRTNLQHAGAGVIRELASVCSRVRTRGVTLEVGVRSCIEALRFLSGLAAWALRTMVGDRFRHKS